MNKTILLFTGLLFVVAGLTLFALARRGGQGPAAPQPEPYAQAPTDWTPGEPIEHFTLTERNGRKFDSASLEGKVWVASFFFASCPANCRKQNSVLAELHKELGPQGVKFVSITCDPETDTPEALANYARSFNAHPENWKFLTGDMTYITYIGHELFNVPVAPQGHSENFILVDQNGAVRGYYTWNDPVELDQMKQTIRGLLDGSIPPGEKGSKPAEEAPAEEATPAEEAPAEEASAEEAAPAEEASAADES